MFSQADRGAILISHLVHLAEPHPPQSHRPTVNRQHTLRSIIRPNKNRPMNLMYLLGREKKMFISFQPSIPFVSERSQSIAPTN